MPQHNPPRTLAVVDLGSNSFRLEVGRVEGEQIFRLDTWRETIRFGAGLDRKGNLTAKAQRDALACLARFAERLAGLHPTAVRAVATNTFRVARNAHEFMPFMEKDLVQAMSTYIFQGVHRAEYTRQFGNDGEWIREKLKDAKREGATQADLMDAAKTVRALEGTLNHDFSPQLRQLSSSALVYENIALMPFALFSSLIDPLGIAVRTGDLKEAWNAFKGGMQAIVDAFKGTEGKDAQTELARLIGVVDERNMLENVGNLYNGMYMSPFLRKVNDTFFKWNGMELWNRRMRVAATAAAQRFLIKHAKIVTARTDAMRIRPGRQVLQPRQGPRRRYHGPDDGAGRVSARSSRRNSRPRRGRPRAPRGGNPTSSTRFISPRSLWNPTTGSWTG